MSKLTLTFAVAGFILGAAGPFAGTANATVPLAVPEPTIIFAQEDCKEGEKWNEETQKCEVNEG